MKNSAKYIAISPVTPGIFVIIAIGLLASGCYSHLHLPPLSRHMPAQQRVTAYKQHEAVNSLTVHVTDPHRRSVAEVPRFLQLEDGRRIHYPEDIVPVVGASSVSGRAATESRRWRRWGDGLFWGGFAAGFAGFASMLVVAPAMKEKNESFYDTPVFWAGLGGALVGVVSELVARHFYGRSNDDGVVAFTNYNSDLQKNLNLCSDQNGRITDCNSPKDKPDNNKHEASPQTIQAKHDPHHAVTL